MRGILIALALGACGASPPPEPPPPGATIGPPIRIVWRTEQADGDQVAVTVVVDGTAIALGTLPAATETEAGTPRTCALRSAHPLRTELGCGEMASYFAAELRGEELVMLLVEGDAQREIKRVPVIGDGLAVTPYAIE